MLPSLSYCLHLFLHSAANDFVDAAKLRTLLKDIADQRGLKVHEGLRIMDAETSAVKLNHLSAMEVNSVRDFLAAGLDLFAKLKDAEANSDATSQTQTQSASTTQQQAPPARNLRA
jgi:hypothetical protein